MKARRWTLIAALVASGTLAVPALELSAQDRIDACYVERTGVMYRIDPAGEVEGDLPSECRNAERHVQFSWTDGVGADHGALEGLEDDDHPQYLQAAEVPSAWAGFEIVTRLGNDILVRAGDKDFQTGFFAECPEGKIAINGGYRVLAPAPLVFRAANSNGPFVLGTGWSAGVIVENTSDTNDATFDFEIRAVCVNAPPGF